MHLLLHSCGLLWTTPLLCGDLFTRVALEHNKCAGGMMKAVANAVQHAVGLQANCLQMQVYAKLAVSHKQHTGGC